MELLKNKLIIFYALAFVFLLAIITFIISINLGKTHTASNSPVGSQPTITPVPQHTSSNTTPPPNIKSLPTLSYQQGGGIDIHAQQTQATINEIQKIYPALPYSHDYQLTTGIKVSVVIPGKELQQNPWTLTVGTYGIDFSLRPSNPNYSTMRASFIEVANDVFNWITTQGADPKKIIYIWGNNASDQQQAENWLQSQ